MKKTIIASALMALAAVPALALDETKPSNHDISWMERHGQASKVDQQECLMCHVDQVSCIQCHQDTEPRDHTSSFTHRTHGLQARWDRKRCQTCHQEDSCVACHESTPPTSHRAGWGDSMSGDNRHCNSCHYPLQETTCFTCHKSAH